MNKKFGCIVTAYCNTKEKEDSLINLLISLRNNKDLFIVLSTHTPATKQMQELCDFTIFEKNNNVDKRLYTHGVAECDLISSAIKILKNNGIENTYKLTYDTVLTDLSIFEEWLKHNKKFVSAKWQHWGVGSMAMYFNIEFFEKNFHLFNDIEEFIKYSTPDGYSFALLETAWEKDIKNNKIEDEIFVYDSYDIMMKDNKTNLFAAEPEYKTFNEPSKNTVINDIELRDLIYMKSQEFGLIQKKTEFFKMVDLFSKVNKNKNILTIGLEEPGLPYFMSSLFENVYTIADTKENEKIIAVSKSINNWKYFLGDINNREFKKKVKNLHVKFDCIYIDADHTYEGVKKNFQYYKEFLSPDGIIVFHDIASSRYHFSNNCFVSELWEELKNKYYHQEILDPDESWGGIGILLKEKESALTNVNLDYEAAQKEIPPINLDFKNKVLESFNSAQRLNIPVNLKNKILISSFDGLKVEIKGIKKEDYKIEFVDRQTDNLIYSTTIKNNNWAAPSVKYYVPWRIKINERIIDFNLEDENVLLTFESSALGDTLAWMPYAEEFRKKHNCKVTVTTFHNYLFEGNYPDITFREPGVSLDSFYAWYKLGAWTDDESRNKRNWRTITLQKVATDILGLTYEPIRPKINYAAFTPKNNNYVCIAPDSTMKCKYWLYPNGWKSVVNYLNNKGFEVYNLGGGPGMEIDGAINMRNEVLSESLGYLANSKFYIGLGSGLSWASWALNIPTILISGFSKPFSEFDCYRVFNNSVCNGCYNDVVHPFDKSWNWCPRKENYICSKSITPEMVYEKIDQLILDHHIY